MPHGLEGYRGLALKALINIGAGIGDTIRIKKSSGTIYEGILVPRFEYGDPECIVLKLKNGYNIGLKINDADVVEKLGEGSKLTYKAQPTPKTVLNLPKVPIIGTGGTIASRVDYRTGAVTPIFTTGDLYSMVPELGEIANVETKVLFNVFSEDMTPKHWIKIAEEIASQFGNNIQGVVVAHGTDTMGYTAAALSFALQALPVPVVLVGSQRSSDRPSSDAAFNLIGAVIAAVHAPFGEVAVAMHKNLSDDEVLIHRGTRVRKCHTSRRDAFKSINADPLGIVKNRVYRQISSFFKPRNSSNSPKINPVFEEKAVLVKYYPGFNPEIIEKLLDMGYRGVILEGTGLGHVGSVCIKAIERARDMGVFIGMTSQCIWGRVNMDVYYTGRDLQRAGVTPLEDMLAETAVVKLMWVLAQTDNIEEIKKLMLTNIAGEFSHRLSYRWSA
ncbi:Glu-tRNA(Gln) amidotransferase subunit GatD [Candidatus Bathyarchaeota archaeon]|nr:Glu-tRNA(Gln) amidotransferase subunit GatD [Candidatus Bathyarchaeota archaeon]